MSETLIESTVWGAEPRTEAELAEAARHAVEFLRFALGAGVHIGTGTVNAIMVQPVGENAPTFTWDVDGCTGWGPDGDDVDYYEVIRRTYFPDVDFYDDENLNVLLIEENVMALGAALEKCVTDLVIWVDAKAHLALEEVLS